MGYLDLIFSPGYEEENDWVMRAQAMGFVAKRANHALSTIWGASRFARTGSSFRTQCPHCLQRHPHYGGQVERSFYSLDGRIAARTRCGSNPPENFAWLSIYAMYCPSRRAPDLCDQPRAALADVAEIELTMIVRHAGQAADIPGRIISEETPVLDVEVIHKPAQVFDPADLGLLFRTPAHVIISYLDLNAYRAQAILRIGVRRVVTAPHRIGLVGRSDDNRHVGRRSTRNHCRIRSAEGRSRGHPDGSGIAWA